eukprot:gb/GECH01008129.1/.p1 GENE.gb/GECH01008129.1/~~gb/GECH01008129.1/.p1  ORF type:complete len:103 (+),score=24.61 gb/GECH01008129.1/:1-309(+)
MPKKKKAAEEAPEDKTPEKSEWIFEEEGVHYDGEWVTIDNAAVRQGENGIIINMKDKERIAGQMDHGMKANGKITKCMAREHITVKTVEVGMENFTMETVQD